MAEPSRANWDADQPRSCHSCGVPLRITRDHIFFRRFPRPASFCQSCAKDRRCIYCGETLSYRAEFACGAHRDLVQLDVCA